MDLVTDQQLNIYLEGDGGDGPWHLPMRPMRPLVEAIDAQVLRPTLRRLCADGGANDHGEVGCPRDLKNRNILSGLPRLKSVFVRKYDDGVRNTLRAHTDQSTFTFNLALENPWDEEEHDLTRAGGNTPRAKKRGGRREPEEGEAPTGDAATAGGQLFVCNPLPYTYSQLLTIHQSMSRDAAPRSSSTSHIHPRRWRRQSVGRRRGEGRSQAGSGLVGAGAGSGSRRRGGGEDDSGAGRVRTRARAGRFAGGHPGTRLHGVSKVSSIPATAGGSGGNRIRAGDGGGRGGGGSPGGAAGGRFSGGKSNNLNSTSSRRRRRVSMIFFYGDEDESSPSIRAAATSATMPRLDMLAWFESLASLARPAYAFGDEKEEAHLDHWVRLSFLEIARVLKRGAEESGSRVSPGGFPGEVQGGAKAAATTTTKNSRRWDNNAADPAVAAEGLKALASAVWFRGRRINPASPPTALQVRLGNEAAAGWLERARDLGRSSSAPSGEKKKTTTQPSYYRLPRSPDERSQTVIIIGSDDDDNGGGGGIAGPTASG